MIEANINGIFPTPVYISKLDRNLTKKELSFIDKSKLNFYKNEGNITSKDNYVLNKKIFNTLKEDLYSRVNDYFNKVLSTTNTVIPFITQSWLNYTKANQYHHKHHHSNSLISGVFYVNCHEKLDTIKFFKNEYQTIEPEIKDWNLFNSKTWWFTVKTGDIILFPSYLTHMVETKEGDNTRISLAFNVFIKGNIGNNKKLNELIL
jgi:uncharacterized protein (TIGR02466 family)